jgi:hypothetical protein
VDTAKSAVDGTNFFVLFIGDMDAFQAEERFFIIKTRQMKSQVI